MTYSLFCVLTSILSRLMTSSVPSRVNLSPSYTKQFSSSIDLVAEGLEGYLRDLGFDQNMVRESGKP